MMGTRADDLRAQADAVEAEEALAAAMETALAVYREDPSATNQAAYKAAQQALADYRQASRAGRVGMSVTAGTVTVEEALAGLLSQQPEREVED